MAIVAAQLSANITVTGATKAAADLNAVGNNASSTADSLRSLAVGAVVTAGAAIVGLGVATTKMAGDFQAGMTTLVTGAGESQSNLGQVSDAILKMAVDTGTTTQQLTAGMFMIESAGYHGAAGLAVLGAAARGAKVGNADLGVVADATTTLMKDYASSNISAANAVNILIATVSNGKTHMQDLATSLSQILPTSSAAKVGLGDVMGAMATMTGEGVPAANAATYLRQTIIGLSAPSSAASKALKAVGLTTAEVSTEMQKSLPGALEMITDAVGKKFPVGSAAYVDAIKNISGGSKTMQGMLDLTGDHLKDFIANVGSVNDAVKKGGNTILGWSAVQAEFNFKISQGQEVLETLGIKIGTALLPVIGTLITNLLPVITQFGNWIISSNIMVNAATGLIGIFARLATAVTGIVAFFQHNQAALTALQGAVVLIAGVIGGTLVYSFGVAAVAAGAAALAFVAAAWPFLAIGAAVTGLIAIFVHFYQTSAPFRAFINEIGTGFTSLWTLIQTNFLPVLNQIGAAFNTYVMPVLRQVGAYIVSAFVPVWKQLVDTFNNQIKPAWNDLVKAITPLLPQLKLFGEFIGGVLLVILAAFAAIVVVSFGIFISILAATVKAVGQLIVGVTIAFGGIVTIISGALQIVSGVVAFFVDLFTLQWGKLWGDCLTIVQGWVRVFEGIGWVIYGLVYALVVGVGTLIIEFVNNVIKFFTGLYDELVGHSIIPDMINGIVSWFEQLPGRAGAAIQSMVSSVINFLSGLATSATASATSIVTGIVGALGLLAGQAGSAVQTAINGIIGILSTAATDAYSAGSSIVSNIASGITAGIGAVGNAISSVASFISSHLPHSPAKMGPLKDLAYQGTQISEQISQGMLQSLPRMQTTMNLLLAPVAKQTATTQSSFAGVAATPYQFPAMASSSAPSAANTNAQPIILTLDGRVIARGLLPYTVSAIRNATGIRGL